MLSVINNSVYSPYITRCLWWNMVQCSLLHYYLYNIIIFWNTIRWIIIAQLHNYTHINIQYLALNNNMWLLIYLHIWVYNNIIINRFRRTSFISIAQQKLYTKSVYTAIYHIIIIIQFNSVTGQRSRTKMNSIIKRRRRTTDRVYVILLQFCIHV